MRGFFFIYFQQPTLEYSTTYGTFGLSKDQTPASTTTYFIRDSNTTTMCVDTTMLVVTVNNQPNISARDTAICAGQSVDLSSLIFGTPQNTLEYGTAYGSYGLSKDQTPASTTTYFVRDSNKMTMCVDSTMLVITVNNQPNISARDTSIMLGEPVDLSTLLNQSPIGVLSFGQTFGTYRITNPVTATATMPFYIRDSVQNEVGCVDTAKVLITIPTVMLSMDDEDGNGHPDIEDPCSCFDPQNVVVSANGNTNVKLFHDFVVISNGGIGQTWQLDKINSGTVLQEDGTPFPIGQALNDLGGGAYRLDFWHQPDIGFNANFRRLSDGNVQTTGGSCDGQACLIIPTMSEWGVFIFGLLILNIGIFFVKVLQGIR